MNKKVFATIGMIVCVLFVIVGLVTMGSDNRCSTGSRSGLYDSGLATFGTDFYTYSNNNAAEAASAARITANNVKELYELLTDLFGWLFVFAGLVGLCHFGIVRAECSSAEAASVPFERDGFSKTDINYKTTETEDEQSV